MANVPDILRLLKALQELDQDLYRVREEQRRLPDELARRKTRLNGERARFSESEKRCQGLRLRVKEIEDATTSQRQRIKKLESEMANSRGDAASLAAYQHEIRTIRRDISESEEEGLGLVDEEKTALAEAQALKSALTNSEKEFEEFAQNVERELAAAERRRRELEAERARRVGDRIPNDILAQYEKLLDAREGQAMAMLDGRICLGCNVNVPNNVYVRLARAVELVPCPSCGRMLYLPEL